MPEIASPNSNTNRDSTLGQYRNVEDADEMIVAINAWKALAKPRPRGDDEEK